MFLTDDLSHHDFIGLVLDGESRERELMLMFIAVDITLESYIPLSP